MLQALRLIAQALRLKVMASFNSSIELQLIPLAATGDKVAIDHLVMLHRDRLKRMIVARMDQRLNRRMDASDVIQEMHVEISKRLPEYLSKPDVPYFVWLRFLARQKLAELIRRNVLTKARDVRREQPLHQGFADSSIALSRYLSGQVESPSSALRKLELRELLTSMIGTLPETDREILLLRHVEQLTTAEAAAELDITENTCRQRHLRALRRMKELLEKAGLRWGHGI